MIHFSCDLCGRSIRDERFIAKIEVDAAFDPEELTEEDLDVDHLDQIAEVIESSESTEDFNFDEAGPKTFQFDLCPNCCRRFMQSPLGPLRSSRMNYSKN